MVVGLFVSVEVLSPCRSTKKGTSSRENSFVTGFLLARIQGLRTTVLDVRARKCSLNAQWVEGRSGQSIGKIPQVMKRAQHVYDRARRRKNSDLSALQTAYAKVRRKSRAGRRVRRKQHRQKERLAHSHWITSTETEVMSVLSSESRGREGRLPSLE